MRSFGVVVLLVFFATALYGEGKGKLRISSDQEGAYIYIDGTKRAMTGVGFTTILLDEGEHKVKIIKEIDSFCQYTTEQSVFVGADTSVKLYYKLKKEKVGSSVQDEEILTRWIKMPDGTVQDTKWSLSWEDTISGAKKTLTWEEAKGYCETIFLNGHDDWRLPTYHELLSIVHYQHYNPAIVKGFKYLTRDSYWSSDVLASDATLVWSVNFYAGNTYYYKQDTKQSVRCVRKISDTQESETLEGVESLDDSEIIKEQKR